MNYLMLRTDRCCGKSTYQDFECKCGCFVERRRRGTHLCADVSDVVRKWEEDGRGAGDEVKIVGDDTVIAVESTYEVFGCRLVGLERSRSGMVRK